MVTGYMVANMVACVETLKILLEHCFTHGLNLVVKAIDSAPEIEDFCTLGLKIMGPFSRGQTVTVSSVLGFLGLSTKPR